jgi:hypothetical protein
VSLNRQLSCDVPTGVVLPFDKAVVLRIQIKNILYLFSTHEYKVIYFLTGYTAVMMGIILYVVIKAVL